MRRIFQYLPLLLQERRLFVLLVLGVRKVSLVSFHLCCQKLGETQLHQQIRQKGIAKYYLLRLKFIRDVFPTKKQLPFQALAKKLNETKKTNRPKQPPAV